jgi:hypothetical protein
LAAGCGSRGAVTFMLSAPSAPVLDPLRDPSVSEFLIRNSDGTLLAAASQNSETGQLALGALRANSAPEDLVMSVLGGTDLLGMARIRNVEIQPGVQTAYTVEVRKPFLFVGSARPDEPDAMNRTLPARVFDPATSDDLAPALEKGTPPAKLPAAVSAAAATSDGRFLLAGHGTPANALAVIDTGSGATVGERPLDFLPWRIATAPRDTAAAVLDSAGSVWLFPDVATLTSTPSAAEPLRVALPAGEAPRDAAFSADGKTLYVVTGEARNLDPCGSMPAPKANRVRHIALDGTLGEGWTLPAFAGAITVAPGGAVVLSLPLAGQVSSISANTPSGAVTPSPLATGLTCPSALHATEGEVFVVTAGETPGFEPDYLLYRVPLAGGMSTALAFTQPVYEAIVNQSDPRDGKISFTLKIRPKRLYAYELAVAPDKSRVAFSVRTRYSEVNETFNLISTFVCRATVEIVEYGLLTLDVRSGSSSYEPHAQLVLSPPPGSGQPCVSCDNGFLLIQFGCPSLPLDRPAGVATVFGTP